MAHLQAAQTDLSKTTLDQLASLSTIVVDTGELDKISQFTPQDATTNPSLILAAVVKNPERIEAALKALNDEGAVVTHSSILERLTITIATDILNAVPGLVSIEVSAGLSFDTLATVNQAKDIIAQLENAGQDTNRVLIKIAATWEGIQAAAALEKQGIRCNVTLVFCLEQAIAAAQAQAYLISPFVGRVLDWHVANAGYNPENKHNDPGVAEVMRIRRYFHKMEHQTLVMAASFRSIHQIIDLAGCDKLTVSPALLEDLARSYHKLAPADINSAEGMETIVLNEAEFRWRMNENKMASDLLGDGIRRFHADTQKLINLIDKQLKG